MIASKSEVRDSKIPSRVVVLQEMAKKCVKPYAEALFLLIKDPVLSIMLHSPLLEAREA